jgi:RNA-directed DNA polymerase
VEKKMTKAPEPEDKLDATTAVVGVVNGPEDVPFDWRQVDWRRVEDDVRRLRQRIFTASKAGDLKKVRNLQKLMLRSYANTLLSVRRVTERNAGRLTAGVDGEVVLTPEANTRLAERIQHQSGRLARARRRESHVPARAPRQSMRVNDRQAGRRRLVGEAERGGADPSAPRPQLTVGRILPRRSL